MNMSNTQTDTSVTVRMWEENMPQDCESRFDGELMTVAAMTVENVLAWFNARNVFSAGVDMSQAVLEDIGSSDGCVWELSDNGFSLFTFYNQENHRRK